MAHVDAIKARAEEMRKKLREIDKLTGVETERSRDVTRKRKQRTEAKTVYVPACINPTRRAEMGADDERWLRHSQPLAGPDLRRSAVYGKTLWRSHDRGGMQHSLHLFCAWRV